MYKCVSETKTISAFCISLILFQAFNVLVYVAITVLFYLPVQSVKEKLVLVSRSLGQSSPTGRTEYRFYWLLYLNT